MLLPEEIYDRHSGVVKYAQSPSANVMIFMGQDTSYYRHKARA